MTTPAPTSPPPMPNDLLHERVKAVCYCETPLIEAIENSWRDGWSAALAAQPPAPRYPPPPGENMGEPPIIITRMLDGTLSAPPQPGDAQPPEPHKEVMPLAETKDEKRIVEQPPSITGGGAPPQPGGSRVTNWKHEWLDLANRLEQFAGGIQPVDRVQELIVGWALELRSLLYADVNGGLEDEYKDYPKPPSHPSHTAPSSSTRVDCDGTPPQPGDAERRDDK